MNSVNDLLGMTVINWLDSYIEANKVSRLEQLVAQFEHKGRKFKMTIEERK